MTTSLLKVGKRRWLKLLCASVTFNSTADVVSASDSHGEGSHLPGDGPGRGGRGRGEYPKLSEEETPPVPIAEVALQISYHPNQDRAVFSAGSFGDGLELYVAEGVSGEADTSSDIWLLTDTDGPVLAPELTNDNLLKYNTDFTRFERRFPPSNRMFESEVIEEDSVQGVNSL